MIYKIFNNDEKALFYKVLPESTYQYKDSKIDYIKLEREVISIFWLKYDRYRKSLTDCHWSVIESKVF